jgi:drug/metabolite transporter (DMT)-like permease
VQVRPIGFLFGLIAAAGQGLGALVSRKGVNVAAAAHEATHTALFGLNAAYHRIFAGLIFTTLWFLLFRALGKLPAPPAPHDCNPMGDTLAERRRARLWLLANGLAGPVLAVGCYQWALATTPSGIVLPIAATSPLIAIPIAMKLEGDHPRGAPWSAAFSPSRAASR